MRQLALPFVHEPVYDPDAFVPDTSNRDALVWLNGEWPAGRLALWGPAGCGKTHLAHVWADRCDAAMLSGRRLAPSGELASSNAIVVDEADEAADEVLLHLLNSAAEDGRTVLLTARAAPSRWPTRLPDLASRLRATPAVGIGPPSDAMLGILFDRLLQERQLSVADGLRRWMLLHLPREAAALRDAAAQLDAAAMAAGRRVGHAMASEVLAKLGCLVALRTPVAADGDV